MSSRLQPSTRITAGLFMLIAGAVLAFVAFALFSVLSLAVILPLFAAPVLALNGILQMIRGLRERAATH